MQKLINQILKFGVVGFICFFIDFAIYTISCNVLGIPYLIAGVLGFTISVIANYILSMKFVFERREDMSRTREFVTFVILSLIGLGLNELILFVCIDVVYMHWPWLSERLVVSLANVGAKIAATGIVMVYNFISRKIFLEKKDSSV
ncbi:MAG: GtrA family protein [Lachnospiraceae bacterium]|nr:GtrA family protein [Lachnospiraceae bacterium]